MVLSDFFDKGYLSVHVNIGISFVNPFTMLHVLITDKFTDLLSCVMRQLVRNFYGHVSHRVHL